MSCVIFYHVYLSLMELLAVMIGVVAGKHLKTLACFILHFKFMINFFIGIELFHTLVV